MKKIDLVEALDEALDHIPFRDGLSEKTLATVEQMYEEYDFHEDEEFEDDETGVDQAIEALNLFKVAFLKMFSERFER